MRVRSADCTKIAKGGHPMNDMNSLSHTCWKCKYHIVFTPKQLCKVFYGEKCKEDRVVHLPSSGRGQGRRAANNGKFLNPFTDSK